MKVIYKNYHMRKERSIYVIEEFKKYIGNKVLDVGCDEAVLKGLLENVKYTGIDIAGKPDIQLNLEEIKELPFPKDEFDTVICTDVLEHLDNLHEIFSELIKVCKGYLIISLPNNWCNARRPIERGNGSFGYYGLPVEKPEDRHKWFFSLEEAICFMKGQTKKYPISIVDIQVIEKPRFFLTRVARKIRYYNQMVYLNRYAHTVWFVLKKEI
jgi:SAM-dependent methyltransferase